jgi:amidophosphoribosyltransferase
VRASIGADSLGYVSLDGLTAATAQPADKLCRACFDGTYPIEIPQPDLIGKHVLEGLARTATADHRADSRAETVAHSSLATLPADHEHTPDGVTVVHNGVGPADPLDALPDELLFPESTA